MRSGCRDATRIENSHSSKCWTTWRPRKPVPPNTVTFPRAIVPFPRRCNRAVPPQAPKVGGTSWRTAGYSLCQTTSLTNRNTETSLPVDIVASAVGLPQEGRERMLVWAEQMFNCFGPLNDRTRGAFSVLQEMMHYAKTHAVGGKPKPNSWAACNDDRLYGAKSGYDNLRHWQRGVALRQPSGRMAESL